LEHILHGAKSYAAAQILKTSATRGHVWERESFDRQVRSNADFWRVVRYVAMNPVKEGLANEPLAYRWLYLHREVVGGLSALCALAGAKAGGP
jgi:REP element-mobilizing transposase RayT